jgi:hypothetical protein
VKGFHIPLSAIADRHFNDLCVRISLPDTLSSRLVSLLRSEASLERIYSDYDLHAAKIQKIYGIIVILKEKSVYLQNESTYSHIVQPFALFYLDARRR